MSEVKEKVKKVTTAKGRFYAVGENKYPSITTVLNAVADKTALLEWRKRVGEEEANRITKESTSIGTAMHACFENFLQGKELPEAITEEQKTGRAMFNAGKLQIQRYVKEVIAQETIVWSDVLKVAGQFDLLCKNHKDELVLVDFKSSKKRKPREFADDYRLQTAFYRQCIKEMFNLDVHHASLFFVTRDLEPYWMTFDNSETAFTELVDVRMRFAELKGY